MLNIIKDADPRDIKVLTKITPDGTKNRKTATGLAEIVSTGKGQKGSNTNYIHHIQTVVGNPKIDKKFKGALDSLREEVLQYPDNDLLYVSPLKGTEKLYRKKLAFRNELQPIRVESVRKTT